MSRSGPVAWLVGTGVLAGAVIAAVYGPAVRPEVWWSLAGPLASSVVSWWLMEGAARQGPDRLMAVMMKALAAKMVFFGAYVVLVVTVAGLRPVPFVACFAGFYIAFHAIETVFVRRLTQKSTTDAGR